MHLIRQMVEGLKYTRNPFRLALWEEKAFRVVEMGREKYGGKVQVQSQHTLSGEERVGTDSSPSPEVQKAFPGP
jgi:hypothetical protein